MTGSDHTLVLGAGFAGLTLAQELADLGPHRVTLVDARERLVLGLSKLWLVDQRRSLEDVSRPLVPRPREGLRFVRGTVESVDAEAREARIDGQAVTYDNLVVALGARLAPEELPGLVESGAFNLFTVEGAEAFGRHLAAFRGGRVLVLVTSLPFKCPPAPYEAAMLAKRFLDRRGVAAEVVIASPEPQPLPVAGKECGDTVRGWVEERGVTVESGRVPVAVDPAARSVRFQDGGSLAYDLLAFVPPHRAPAAVRSLHGPNGWIPADAATLATRHERVWAVGDCNVVTLPNGRPLVKAGVMAEGEARVVARRIAGDESARFDGKGHCYLELGDGLATEVHGDFYATPNPIVAAKPPTKAALAAKDEFVRERLARWLAA